jgi:hypothetical protein
MKIWNQENIAYKALHLTEHLNKVEDFYDSMLRLSSDEQGITSYERLALVRALLGVVKNQQ